jgi:hypothetical protein
MLFFGGIIREALSRQFTDEFKAWTPWIFERLLRRSVDRLPEEHRGRFEEEWRAHLNEIPGDIGKLLVVVGYLSAARRMSSIFARGSHKSLARTSLRRLADICLSVALLIWLAPLLLILAFLIRLDGGPVFSSEVTVGLKSRTFFLRKFRVHEHKVELPGIPQGDSQLHLTLIGRFLRIAKLDELPEFINVLRGDMTLRNFLLSIAFK